MDNGGGGNGGMEFHLRMLFLDAEMECNRTVLSQPPPTEGVYCPALFDGWSCFNYTKGGDTAYSPCPNFPVFNPLAQAVRKCEENGSWWVNPLVGEAKSDHTACLHNRTEPDEIPDHESFSYVYLFIAGASLSLILLTISLVIFYGFRQLRCDRVTIHKNLFISYIFTALTWIIYYRAVVLDGDVIIANPVWCQFLHVLAQYFTTTNFSWMFCEGLYLHIIMAHALRTGKKLIKCLVIGGWGVPFLLTVVYGAVRGGAQTQAHSCWIADDVLQWIIAGPILASVVINICILVNLVRLLMTKLRQIPDAPQSRKAAKATLILVPLFGLQFLTFPVRPDEGSPLHDVYLHFMALLMSLQGTLVAIIFCFCNGEVKSLLRRKWQQHMLMTGGPRKNTAITSSTLVDGYSVVDTARDGNSLRVKVPLDSLNRTDTLEMRGSPKCSTPLVEKSQANTESVYDETTLGHH
ncbi:calcitonin receptor [Aplysia californica]|uniref:Calcitonin receptor n=1 Tax=Aplysia californica TaxID=6500 RepID=A0ABM0JHI4_APLCA|nr:calcitonin receptor [Aplysia californica]XP_012941228.1 calcitonin receptor [Aplysia californica]